jgi:muconolactone delta-isomerase
MSATIGIALVVQAQSAPELDELLMSLPLWPLMETTVTPLTTFDGRIAAIRPGVGRLAASLKK